MAENGPKSRRFRHRLQSHLTEPLGFFAVMPGLVPGIHVGPMVPVPESYSRPNHVDGRNPHVCGFRSQGRKSATADFRDEPGHDGGEGAMAGQA